MILLIILRLLGSQHSIQIDWYSQIKAPARLLLSALTLHCTEHFFKLSLKGTGICGVMTKQIQNITIFKVKDKDSYDLNIIWIVQVKNLTSKSMSSISINICLLYSNFFIKLIMGLPATREGTWMRTSWVNKIPCLTVFMYIGYIYCIT